MEQVKCKTLTDLANIILKSDESCTYIKLCPSDIGIDTPNKLFFFLIGILNECLTILCDNEILIEHLYIFQKKIESVGFKMNIRIEPNNNQMTRILMGHMCENKGTNLIDYKLVSIFPEKTYVICFDYITQWKASNCRIES